MSKTFYRIKFAMYNDITVIYIIQFFFNFIMMSTFKGITLKY